jgi:hypothetical protein
MNVYSGLNLNFLMEILAVTSVGHRWMVVIQGVTVLEIW